mgnify:FL=1
MKHIYNKIFSFRLALLTVLLTTAMTSLRAQDPTITVTFTGVTKNSLDWTILTSTSTPAGFDWDYSLYGYVQDTSSFSCTTDTENGGAHFSFETQSFEYYLKSYKEVNGSVTKNGKVAELDVVLDKGVTVAAPTIKVGNAGIGSAIGHANSEDGTEAHTFVFIADADNNVGSGTITITLRTEDSKQWTTNGITVKAIRLYNLYETQELVPAVSTSGEEEVMGGTSGLGEEIEAHKDASVVLAADDKALFTFPVAGNGDGYYEEGSNKLVVLNTPQDEVPVDLPGLNTFNQAFTGVTLLVPAGEGEITIDARTEGASLLNVQVGTCKPRQFTSADFKEHVVKYAVTSPTFVYIFKTESAGEGSSAASRAPGRKMANTTSLRRIKVKARSVAAAPPRPESPKTLTKDDVKIVDGHITVDDPAFADIADDAFADVCDADVTYVDLSKTSITDYSFHRDKDFNMSKFVYCNQNAIILVPFGNHTIDENIVVGGICNNLLLKGDANFDLPQDILATTATLDTDFTALDDKTTTVVLPFALDEEQAAAIGSFYEFKNIADGKVNMQPATAVDANKPYLLKATADELTADMVEVKTPAALAAEARRAAAEATAEMVGVYKPTTLSSGAYIYNKGKFELVATATQLPAFQAYINAPGATATPLDIQISDPSGISQVHGEGLKVNGAPVYYDLQGRRVLRPTKGVYILNGKKLIVR